MRIVKARLEIDVRSEGAGRSSRTCWARWPSRTRKLTYQRYKKIFSGPEWEPLQKKSAQTQRVLWASTSTKDPSYPDVLYVEELIGPDTVNTIPPATFDAFRDHGNAEPSLEAGYRCRARHHGHARAASAFR